MNNGEQDSRFCSYETPEADLMATFRIAAQSVTELYTKGVQQRRQAYQNGYQKCLEDLMDYLTQRSLDPSANVQNQRSQGGEHNQSFSNATITGEELCNWARSKHREIQTSGPSRPPNDPPNSRHVNQQQQGEQQSSTTQQPSFQPNVTTEHPITQSYATPNIAISTNVFGSGNDQFTFCFPTHTMYNQPSQRETDGIDPGQEGGIGILVGNDTLKRRYAVQEQNFLGRPMEVSSFFEPSFKRGRVRKED